MLKKMFLIIVAIFLFNTNVFSIGSEDSGAETDIVDEKDFGCHEGLNLYNEDELIEHRLEIMEAAFEYHARELKRRNLSADNLIESISRVIEASKRSKSEQDSIIDEIVDSLSFSTYQLILVLDLIDEIIYKFKTKSINEEGSKKIERALRLLAAKIIVKKEIFINKHIALVRDALTNSGSHFLSNSDASLLSIILLDMLNLGEKYDFRDFIRILTTAWLDSRMLVTILENYLKSKKIDQLDALVGMIRRLLFQCRVRNSPPHLRLMMTYLVVSRVSLENRSGFDRYLNRVRRRENQRHAEQCLFGPRQSSSSSPAAKRRNV